MARRRSKNSIQSSGSKSKLGVSLTPTALDTLSKIAKKAEISKSELFERIAGGTIAIASHSAQTTIIIETPPEATSQSSSGTAQSQTKIEVTTGVQESQAQDDDQVIQKDESYQDLEEKLAEQANFIAELQQQLSEQQALVNQKAENYQEIQQKSAEQNNLITDLQKQLEEQQALVTQKAENYQEIQQKSAEQNNLITDLQKQLSEQQTLVTQKAESYQEIQQKSAEQANLIAELRQQLEEQPSIIIQKDGSDDSLAQVYKEQADRIATLQKYVDQLKPLAKLGKEHLNRKHRRF
ncbi:MAG: hypothetical protein F6K10_12215 [Moorea sp. SIO2B7]|nr:hypothetical protein [Moorena sp. SIO2B7]